MIRTVFTLGIVSLLWLGLGAPAALAQDQDRDRDRQESRDTTSDQDRDRDQDRDQERAGDTSDSGALPDREPVYGWELMSEQERAQHREAMRNAGSTEERNRLREEHRKQMEARARERGVELAPPHFMALRPEAPGRRMESQEGTRTQPQPPVGSRGPGPGAGSRPGGGGMGGPHGGGGR